jgi:uncharacterized protein YkwD
MRSALLKVLLILLLLAVAPLALGVTSAPTAPAFPPPPQAAPAEVQTLVLLVNQHRVARGLEPLEWDDRLARVALEHSRDMSRRNYFGHVDPDGRGPFDRLAAAGIVWSAAGENVAAGYRGPRAVLDGWLASPGHRANLESPEFTRQGIGLDHGRWTHVFIRGTEAETP